MATSDNTRTKNTGYEYVKTQCLCFALKWVIKDIEHCTATYCAQTQCGRKSLENARNHAVSSLNGGLLTTATPCLTRTAPVVEGVSE